MSTATATSLRISRTIAAPIERVFEAWTQPVHMMKWACPEGASVELAEVELEVGGTYRIRMQTETGVHTAHGVYREIEVPTRLVYTWDWEERDFAVGETVVTVNFVARGDATEVVLTHDAFPAAEATAAHEQGWGSCLNRLEALLAR